jgi:hypothetical protein
MKLDVLHAIVDVLAGLGCAGTPLSALSIIQRRAEREYMIDLRDGPTLLSEQEAWLRRPSVTIELFDDELDVLLKPALLARRLADGAVVIYGSTAHLAHVARLLALRGPPNQVRSR